jgi:hypothetical protein
VENHKVWHCCLILVLPSSVASMDEVIHCAPWCPGMKSSLVPAALLKELECLSFSHCLPPFVASMDEVIHSAPWRPGMKSSLVPAALFQRSCNTSPSQTGTPVCFAHFCRCLLTSLCLHVAAGRRPLRDGQGRRNSTCQGFVKTVQSSSPKVRTRIQNCLGAHFF